MEIINAKGRQLECQTSSVDTDVLQFGIAVGLDMSWSTEHLDYRTFA